MNSDHSNNAAILQRQAEATIDYVAESIRVAVMAGMADRRLLVDAADRGLRACGWPYMLTDYAIQVGTGKHIWSGGARSGELNIGVGPGQLGIIRVSLYRSSLSSTSVTHLYHVNVEIPRPLWEQFLEVR